MFTRLRNQVSAGSVFSTRGTAIATLLLSGLMLGITTNLSRFADASGINPMGYLTSSLTGATLVLSGVLALKGQVSTINRHTLEYFLIAGLLTIAGANLIFFFAVGKLGVGFVALMYSLPPLLTYAGALAMRMESFCPWRAAGVALALAGTAFLVLHQWVAPASDHFWISIALVAPVLISAGNLYRTYRWPAGASPESLEPGMLVSAVIILCLFATVTGISLDISWDNRLTVTLLVVQAGVFAGQYLLLFILQKAGGPVFLSLMGGVSAMFGIPIATVLLAEPLLPGFIASAGLIAAGIGAMLMGMKACEQVQGDAS